VDAHPRLAWPLAVALVLSLAAPAARADEGPRIAAVEVEGNRRVEADAVRAAVSKKGAVLDLKRVDADVRALMRLGFFEDVVVEVAGPKDAPVLVYRVRERRAVKEATIVGNDELSKDDLKETVEVKPFSMLDLVAVKKDVKKIQEKYVEKGFFLAEVTWRLEDLPDNQVAVRYLVNEKAKVMVKEIRFLGNRRISSDVLKAAMLTQEGGMLSFLGSSGTYREDMFQRDLAVLSGVYLDQGYINAKVGKPAIALSPDKRDLFITIPLEEGEQYTIGKLSFSGQLLGEEPRLRRLLQSRTGELFARSRIGADLFAVGDVFKDLGYAYANVTPLTNLDAEKRIVDVAFEVQPGQKCRFERIEVVGNDKTRDKVVRRELRIYEGETYGSTSIKLSKGRVTALGFFETVEITTRKGSADDLIVATVEIKEKATGSFQLGAGYSSYENFILTGQISQQNFLGWGQTLSLNVQWSSIRQLGQVQFVEPYFLDTKWTFAFDVYATESFYSTFTRRAVGGNVTWGYELNGLAPWWAFAARLEDMRVFATYKNEYVDVSGSSLTNSLGLAQVRSGTTSSVTLAWQWDKRDNRLFPTSGWFASASAELAPPALAPSSVFGHQVNLFTRYNVDVRGYRPLLWGVVARAKATAGLIRNWDTSKDVSIAERFYLGGINSVRGYRFLSIAPSTPTPCDAASPVGSQTCTVVVGGNKQLVLNFELEFPLAAAAGIKGVLFADAGNVFAAGKWDDPSVPYSLFRSVGFGFRWVSPIGPLRFEWGIPLDRRKDPRTGAYSDQALDFQFTIGNFF
jgi:outer membrane protein insertion porin family